MINKTFQTADITLNKKEKSKLKKKNDSLKLRNYRREFCLLLKEKLCAKGVVKTIIKEFV